MKKMIHTALMLSLAMSLTGCQSMTGCLSGCQLNLREKCIAQKAWNEWSWCYDELDHPKHFA